MRTALQIAPSGASKVVAGYRDESQSVPVIEIFRDKSQKPKWFPGLAKRLSKDKAAAAIHHLTGERERTCYDWCAGAVDPPARAIVKLLHSEVGWIALEYLMRGCRQQWWLDIVRARACAAAFDNASEQLKFEFP